MHTLVLGQTFYLPGLEVQYFFAKIVRGYGYVRGYANRSWFAMGRCNHRMIFTALHKYYFCKIFRRKAKASLAKRFKTC